MKKSILFIFSLLFLAFSVQAQDAKDYLKDAEKALSSFRLDQGENKEELKIAVENINQALDMKEGQNMVDAWIAKGDIYNEIATQITTARQLGFGNEGELPQVENPAIGAAIAYQKAYEMAEKNRDEKDALEGLQLAQRNLANMGIFYYEDGEFGKAFTAFKEVLDVHDMLTELGEESSLAAEEDVMNQMYITGLAALNGNMLDAAAPYFEKLYEAEFDKPAIYEALYKINYTEENPEKSYKYLEKGRDLYPEDVSLLFADINYHLRTQQLDKLIDKIQLAIEKEPNNVTLYITLGNVYDQLFQKSLAAENDAQAQEYFNNALDYYQKGLEIDPDAVDAIYSIGALYYNRAADMTQEMNSLADDYSKEGIEKYNQMKEKVFKAFDDALPYFQKAEMVDPNDLNTLIALREIYARKDMLDVSNAFKERLENVQAGQENEMSYFKKHPEKVIED